VAGCRLKSARFDYECGGRDRLLPKLHRARERARTPTCRRGVQQGIRGRTDNFAASRSLTERDGQPRLASPRETAATLKDDLVRFKAIDRAPFAKRRERLRRDLEFHLLAAANDGARAGAVAKGVRLSTA
jgi:hypothetical protein